MISWLPRRYCKNAETNNPISVTVNMPKTIPNKNGSIINLMCYILYYNKRVTINILILSYLGQQLIKLIIIKLIL